MHWSLEKKASYSQIRGWRFDADYTTVIRASSGSNGPVNKKLQKFFAIIIVTLVCQLQTFSRSIYVKTSDLIALFKVLVLCLIAIGGLVALSGQRRHGPEMITTPYGRANLQTDFALRTANPFQYSVAMLDIMRAFLGYENANFVRRADVQLEAHLTIVPGPHRD